MTDFIARHLVAKTVVIIAASVLIVSVFATAYFNTSYKNELLKTFNLDVEHTSGIIERSYAEPLWSIHSDLIRNMNEALLSPQHYIAINVYTKINHEQFEIVISSRKMAMNDFIEYVHSVMPFESMDADIQSRHGYIHYQDRIIGKYDLFYTLEGFQSQIRMNFFNLVKSFVFMSIVMISVMAILLNKHVILKLSRLMQFARKVATDKMYDQRITFSGKDEIGELSNCINTMLEQIEIHGNAREAVSRELLQSREYLQSIFDACPDAIFIHDPETGLILDVNNAACRLFMYPREQLVGKDVGVISSGDSRYDSAAAMQWFQKAGNEGPQKFFWHAKRLDDHLLWTEVHASHARIGGESRLIVMVQDISDRRRAEQERDRLQKQLLQSQKMESIGILAGGVAHDFNNLLHVMRGNIELLARNPSIDAQGADRLQTVTRGLDRAARLVRQLLLFSRKAESTQTPVDVNREVRDAVRMLERTIPKMVSLELHLEPALRRISGDSVQIEQALLNLANNAVDAMPEGGRLVIETFNVDLDQHYVARHPGAVIGPHVLLSVTDTGCGMDAATLEHAFDPFFTTKEVGQGTGLGLASVYGIVRGHGGHIQCASTPGGGSTFRLYFPAADQVDETPKVLEPEPSPRGGGEIILVVDDEAEIQELTREALEDLGFTVLGAASGEEALEAYRKHGPAIDLVLLDLNMPGMGGHKCLQELLRLDPAARVLIASGYSAQVQTREVLHSGAKGYIGKPYRLRELEAKVREVLDAEGRGEGR